MRKPTGPTPLRLVKHEGRDPPDESAPTVIHADKLSELITRTQAPSKQEQSKPLSRNMKTLMENRAKAHQPAESWGNPAESTQPNDQTKLSAYIASKNQPSPAEVKMANKADEALQQVLNAKAKQTTEGPATEQ